MDLEFINMQMELFMRVNMKMTRKQDMVYINGQMEEFIRDIGLEVNSMAQEFSRILIKIRQDMDFGKMVKEYSGLIKQKKQKK